MTACCLVFYLAGAFLRWFAAPRCAAQDNYEIQVYGSDTVEPGHTMFELHSNFTIDGSEEFQNGLYPTNHAEHETLEITHGFNSWFEVGFYVFTSVKTFKAGSGSAITSGRASACRKAGIGRWA